MRDRWFIFALAAVIVLIVFVVRMPRGNSEFLYPDRVGAIPSLYELRNAAVAFINAHDGALPRVPADLAPYVVTPAKWRYDVTPAQLLPHLFIEPVTATKPPIEVGPGRFVLMVHLPKSGGMKHPRTIAVGETESGFKEQYADYQIAAGFGEQRLADLKANAFKVP